MKFINTNIITIILIVCTFFMYSYNNIKNIFKNLLIKTFWANKPAKNTTENSINNIDSAKTNKKTIKQQAKHIFLTLKKIFKENRKIRKYLRTTPWYIIIGENNCGKTTAINNSGLTFLSTNKLFTTSLQNTIGAIANCKYWFTSKAIFVDISHNNDKSNKQNTNNYATIFALLKTLRKYHQCKHISGLIVTIDIHRLCIEDVTHKQSLTKTTQLYINSFYKQLSTPIPLYIIFTKCDLIAGFTEFFNDLNKNDREQIFGITCPLDLQSNTKSLTEFFTREYDKLITSLNERIIWRLASEHDSKRRELISYFPQQLKLIENILVDFITNTFTSDDICNDNTLHFRGIYFSSAEQSASPKDFIMDTITERLKLQHKPLPKQMFNTQSYFLKSIFTQVIYSEKELVGNKPVYNIRKRKFWYCITPVVLVLFITGISISNTQNKLGIQQARNQLTFSQQIATRLSTNKLTLTSILPILNSVQKVGYAFHHVPHPWLLYFATYTPFTIKTSTSNALNLVLEKYLIPQAAKHVESLLQHDLNNQTAMPYIIYNDLKAYLAFNLTKRLKPTPIIPLIENSLNAALKNNPDKLAELNYYLQLTIKNGLKPIKINYNLVSQAREILRKTSLSKRAYWNVKQNIIFKHKKTSNLISKIYPSLSQIFTNIDTFTKIPYIYTYVGFNKPPPNTCYKEINKISANDIILGIINYRATSELKRQMANQCQQLYVQEYLQFWQDILNKLHITKLRNIDQAIHVIDMLTSKQSPLTNLLVLINDNTSPVIFKQNYLNRSINHLNNLTQQSHNKYEQLNKLYKQLEKLQDYLTKINSAPNKNTAAFESIKLIMNNSLQNNPFTRLDNTAKQLPEPLNKWINSIVKNSFALLLQNSLVFINNKWQTNIIPKYNNYLANLYPINKHASSEIDLDNFSNFFAPNGIMDTFYQRYLSLFINSSNTTWRWKSPFGQSIPLSNEFLTQLCYAELIKNNYFTGKNQQTLLRFSIKPIAIDTHSSEVILQTGNHNLAYAHGPQQEYYWRWPSTSDKQSTTIVFTDFDGNISENTYRGNWSLFKMFCNNKLRKTNKTAKYILTIHKAKHYAQYQINTSAPFSALNLELLNKIKLPKTLIPNNPKNGS